MNYSVHGGPRMCVQHCNSSTSTRKQKEWAILPYAHIWEQRWKHLEESVSCQRGDIKPSYIKQFIKPLMMQDCIYTTWLTQRYTSSLYSSSYKDKLPAICKGNREVGDSNSRERREMGKKKKVSDHECCFSDLYLSLKISQLSLVASPKTTSIF